jgi:uncharacterized protein YlxP (DUF503 family)
VKILLVQLDLQFYAAQSLKEKRSTLKRIVQRLRQRLNVSVAEVDHHDEHDCGTIALVTVSMLEEATERTIASCLREIELAGDVEIVAENREWL